MPRLSGTRLLRAIVVVLLVSSCSVATSKRLDSAAETQRWISPAAHLTAEPRFVGVKESCRVPISGAPTRSGTCKATALCADDGKESVPGYCSGGTDNQCCVTPIPCQSKADSGGNREAGWCREESRCSTGNSQSSSYGATGCQKLPGPVKCCVGAGGNGNEDDNERADGDDDDEENERSDRMWSLGRWVWDYARQAWKWVRNYDGYPVAPPYPTCPADRQMKRACKENYGNSKGCAVLREPFSSCPSNCQVNIKKLSLGGQSIDWVCQHDKSGPKRGYTQSARGDPTRDTPPPITRHTILQRAALWLDQRVRYSQRRHHGNPAYRTDCTGYVSMAFDLPQWGTTGFVRGALSYSKEKTIERVACKSLLPGDSLVSEGHIVLFRKWVDQTAGTMEWWEERGTAYGTVSGQFAFANYGALSSSATDAQVTGRGKYWCLRRKNIVG